MSNDKGKEASKSTDNSEEAAPESNEAKADASASPRDGESPSGPSFNETPDPLAGMRRWSRDTWDSMEGKTVSMRTYVGTIAAVTILMMLARCGG